MTVASSVFFCFLQLPAPAVQTPCSLPPVPSGLPSLFTGSHSETGAVLWGPGGARRTQPRLWLCPLHLETGPAARGGPQGQWPHRRMSGENACPSYDTVTVQVPLSFLRGLKSNSSWWEAGGRDGNVLAVFQWKECMGISFEYKKHIYSLNWPCLHL